MNDDLVLNIVSSFNRNFNKCLDKHQDVKDYLVKRYNDIPEEIFTYKEVIYRIQNNIEKRPVCKLCGNSVKFMHKNGKIYYSDTCCLKCKQKLNGIKAEQSKQIKYGPNKKSIYDKVKKTNLEKYGVENVFANKDIQAKIKNTNKEKYGSEFYLSSIDSIEKRKETWIQKYGVDNPYKSEIIKNKIKQTSLQKYGSEHYLQTEEGRLQISEISKSKETLEKRFNSCLEHFGYKTPLANKEIYLKKLETCKNNNSYRTSKEENIFYSLLLDIDENTQRQYYSELYPYACDFYLPLFNLYIEYQGSQFHHGRLFKGTVDDMEELLHVDDHTKYVWSQLDVKKNQTAIDNNLNYLMIYPDWHKDWKYFCRCNGENINIKNLLLVHLKQIIQK